MGSLLGETFLQFLLSLTLKLHSLGNLWSNLLFGVGNSSDVVSIGVSNNFSGFGLSLLDNLGLDKFGLCCNLVILQVCLSVDLLDFSSGLCLPFLFDFLSVGLDLLNLLRLCQLLELSLLFNIFSLLLFNLLLLDLLFLIVLNSLLVRKGLPLERVHELVDRSLLHGTGDFLTQYDIGDDDSLHKDSLVAESRI